MAHSEPEPLGNDHAFAEFDCGVPALDDWLAKHALAAQASGTARVFVTTDDAGDVVGFYALAAGAVEPRAAPARVLKGQPPNRPVPVVLLARLAVHRRHQGRGVGLSLLSDALLRCIAAADEIGIRAVAVHATNEEVRDWYERWGFQRSPTDPLHLILLLKDLRKTLGV